MTYDFLNSGKGLTVFYHEDNDGFAAAAYFQYHLELLNKNVKKVKFLSVQYNRKLPTPGVHFPQSTASDILILDFSLKYHEYETLLKKGYNVTVIDHHGTAENVLRDVKLKYPDSFQYVFDLNKCGAMLTVEYMRKCYPVLDPDHTKVDYLINLVDLRDRGLVFSKPVDISPSLIEEALWLFDGSMFLLNNLKNVDTLTHFTKCEMYKDLWINILKTTFTSSINEWVSTHSVNCKIDENSTLAIYNYSDIMFMGIALRKLKNEQLEEALKYVNKPTLTTLKVSETETKQFSVIWHNYTGENTSDFGNLIAEKMDCDFVILYRVKVTNGLDTSPLSTAALSTVMECKLELRGLKDNIDLGEIAKLNFNGGGHKKAAGGITGYVFS